MVNTNKLSRGQAKDICEGIAGKLANIYDNNHLDAVMRFIRAYKKIGKDAAAFWTGMTYNTTVMRMNNLNCFAI